ACRRCSPSARPCRRSTRRSTGRSPAWGRRWRTSRSSPAPSSRSPAWRWAALWRRLRAAAPFWRTPIRIRLEDPPTAIRPTAPEDAAAQLALRLTNREHTGPWDPARDDSFYPEAGQRLELDLDQRSWAAGSAYAFAVLDTQRADRLIGRVALSNVVRGPWQNATLGYWIDKDSLGKGHATRAVRLVLRFAF